MIKVLPPEIPMLGRCSCPIAHGFQRTAFGRNPENPKRCNASQLLGLALGKLGSGFHDQVIDLTSFDIRGYLLIPALVFKFVEPIPQRRKVPGRQIADTGFDRFDFAQDSTSS